MTKANFNLRERLAALTPQRSRPTFRGSPLPDRQLSVQRDRDLRRAMTDRLSQSDQPAEQLSYSRNELMSKLFDVVYQEEPVEGLRQFHEHHLLRIVDLYRETHDIVLTARQLADLRTSLVTWAFRMSAEENPADMALAIGGSAANGVHTFLTDFDFVVLPHAEQDREAARNTQRLMAGIMTSIGIDADFVMPQHFNYQTFPELEQRYGALLSSAEQGLALKDFVFKASASFFRFFMDVRVIDHVERDAAQPVGRESYEARLRELQDRLIYSTPEHVIQNCLDSFEGDIHASTVRELDREYLFNIKNMPMRLLHYAIYAARARTGIGTSDLWQAMEAMESDGLLTAEEREEADFMLRFFVGLRHMIGLTSTDTMDSTKIDDNVMMALCQATGLEQEELSGLIEQYSGRVIDISMRVFERLGYRPFENMPNPLLG